MADWRELKRQLEERQTGVSAEAQDIDKQVQAMYSGESTPQSRAARRAAFRGIEFQQPSDFFTPQQIVETGYGEDRRDANISFDDWISNPDYRANVQSNAAKVLNGLAKMVPYAATTFLDNTLGLVAGLANIGVDATNGDEEFHPMDSLINNPVSEYLDTIRQKSEEWFPNYRTQEEIEDQDQWWKHLNANFWGDTVLKNLGFTIGAGLAGGLYAKGFKALQGKVIDKAYKAAAAAAIDGNKAADTAVRSIMQGAPVNNPKKIYDAFNQARRSFGKIGAESVLVGGIGGAIGESRIEAMQAAKEFRDDKVSLAEQQYQLDKDALQTRVIREMGYEDVEPIYDQNGNVVDAKPIFAPEVQSYYDRELEKLQQKYGREKSVIDNEASDLAATTFWLNMPLLTASNAIMFGRLYSGGFNSQAKNAVRGTFGNYLGKGSKVGAVARGLGNTLTEGLEELSQKVVSEGAKSVADYNIGQFHNNKYDEYSLRSMSDWLYGVAKNAGNVIKDPTSWEEFAVGALIGAFGMPTHAGISNWSGGIIGGVQEGLAKMEDSKSAAARLNETIQSKEFQDRWEGLTRHVLYEKQKDAALKDNDKYTWESLNQSQLISDIMMFADAGRLNDLEEYVDSFTDLSVEDVEKLKGSFIDETDPNFANKTPEQIRDWLTARAKDVKKTINQYRDYHDAVDFLSFGTSDPEAVNELVYTEMQLKNFESRYNRLLNEVLAKVSPYIRQVASERKKDGTPTERAQTASKLLESENDLRDLFGGYVLDTQGRAQDANPSRESFMAYLVDDKRQEQVLKDLESIGTFAKDAGLKNEVKDLQKLVRSRQNFYAKIFNPSFRQTFEKSAKTPAQVAQKLQKQSDNKKADNYVKDLENANGSMDTVDQIRRGFKEAENKKIFMDGMRNKAKTDKNAADFVGLHDAYTSFRAALSRKHFDLVNKKTGDFSRVGEIVLDSLFDASNTGDEFVNRLGTNTPSIDYVNDVLGSLIQSGAIMEEEAFGPMVAQQYMAMANAIADTAQDFKDSWAGTSGREAIKDVKAEEPKQPVNDDKEPEPAAAPKPGEQQAAPTEQKPVEQKPEEKLEEKPVIEEPTTNPTVEEAKEDVYSSFQDNSIPEDKSFVRDSKGSVKRGYYQQSIPEIPLTLANRVRELLLERKTASKDEMEVIDAELNNLVISDFVEYDEAGNPTGENAGYSPTYKWLKERGAFQYIATKLKPNDEVVFAILEDCPKYNGRNQIVVAVVTERNDAGEISEVQPLTILHSTAKAGEYLNLNTLYDAIYEDYDSQSPDGQLYVFGGKRTPKTSRVFDKRPGLVRYIKGGEPTSITAEGHEYDPNAPIMILDENMKPVLLRGGVDASKIFLPNIYEWSANHIGRVYYLVSNGNNTYTPILLDKAPIGAASVRDSQGTGYFSDIKKVTDAIDGITAKLSDKNLSNSNISLKKQIGALNNLMNLDGISFDYIDKGDGAPVLAIEWTERIKSPQSGEVEIPHYVELTKDQSILDAFDEMSRPARISYRDKYLSGTRSNLQSMIDAGLLTTNALELRQVGVNFLFDPWNPSTGNFERVLQGPVQQKAKPIPQSDTHVVARDAEMGDDSQFSPEAMLPTNIPQVSEPQPEVESLSDMFASDDMPVTEEYLTLDYDKLSQEQKEILEAKKVSEDVWNRSNDVMRRHFLNC